MITAWWAGLGLSMKILWGITLTASLIFVIQTILTFIGADADTDFDVDAGNLDGFDGHSGMNLYTFRNLVNFLLGFGWTAILLRGQIASTGWLLVVSALVGILLVVLVMYIFKWLNSMQQNGTIDVYKSAVGCQGKVYLTIPGERAGNGKIQVTINNSVREYDAQTDGETLPTGAPVRIVEVLDGETMLVEGFNSLII